MSSEILKRDENHVPVIGLVTDDANLDIKMGRIDDATKGLKVMIVGGSSYTLPIASASVLGGIKVGTGLAIDAGTGVLSASGSMVYPSGSGVPVVSAGTSWSTTLDPGTPATNVYLRGAVTTGALSFAQVAYADVSGTPNLGNYLAAAGGTVGSGSQAQAFTLGIKIAQIGGTAGKYSLFQGGAQTADITYTLPVAAPVTLSGNLRSTTAGVLSWDETVYLSTLTTSTPTNLTGFIKGNGSVLSADNTSYLPLTGGTMTGNLTIGDAKQIVLTAPTADVTSTGFSTSAFNSGYTSSAVGDLVYLDSSATWQKTDADSTTTAYGLIGMALAVAASGAPLLVALPGSFVRVNSWAWTVGAPLYLGETPGAMQEAIPTGANNVIRVVGFAVNADYIYFYPSQDVQTTVA